MGLLKEIINDFKAVKNRDPAFKNNIELLYAYPGVWALVFYRISNRLYKKNFKRLARFIMAINQFLTNIDIHPGAAIKKNVFIDHGIGVVIGETAIVGNNVTIYQGVTLGGVSLNPGKRHPTIEDDCIIGAGAKILGDITIGKGSKIGANSVVVKDVPPYSTVVGIPGKVIKRKDYSPLGHNKLPDIEKELFEYLMDRIKVLEEAIINNDKNIIEKDEEIEKKYRDYIEALKNK
ncbi:serine O-acetyltransferase [Caminibacter mediatlanticus TB-2]|uniref:Serine acetyltransferase n=1 Tax=Caminibacter mediatlanticus TB-2 TaxID=391592 RepID=A0ABX5VBJ2_9BACT|nr:serine O-acetyltransferase [Caminibacter mediatlanticus]QCT94902.1 serine O-acetyltransferase [Caminibacter mediatlanticus TB-2]